MDFDEGFDNATMEQMSVYMDDNLPFKVFVEERRRCGRDMTLVVRHTFSKDALNNIGVAMSVNTWAVDNHIYNN